MPGSTPFVDNDLLSSLGETLLVFEHLFDTRIRGVSRVAGRWDSQGEAVGLARRGRGIGGEVGLAGRRDRKPVILLAFSRFWKPIAQISTFVETKPLVAVALDAPPPFGYRERGETPKRFTKTYSMNDAGRGANRSTS